MRLIVGLGNPGIEYQFTPHNLGYLVVDRLANEADEARVRVERPEARSLIARTEIEGRPVVLAKPLTFMNLSGLAVRELLARWDLEASALVVVYDELALPAGSLRIRTSGGDAGHNGLASIIGALGDGEFVRVRMGIAPDHPRDATEFVLRQFRRSELKQVEEQIGRAAEAVRCILREGPERAMNIYNRRPDQGEGPDKGGAKGKEKAGGADPP